MPKPHAANPIKPHKFIDKAIIVVALVQPLATAPQLVTIYRTHDATGIALTTWFIYVLFNIFWLWYGITQKQKAIIVSATMFGLMEGGVFIGGLLYGASW